jgi:hypothetical protein
MAASIAGETSGNSASRYTIPKRDQPARDAGIEGGGKPLFAGRQPSRLGLHGGLG